MMTEYTKVGDYYFPNIKRTQRVQLSKYARMKEQYLKNHQLALYHKLLAKNELDIYLLMIDKEANELYDRLLADLKRKGILLRS